MDRNMAKLYEVCKRLTLDPETQFVIERMEKDIPYK